MTARENRFSDVERAFRQHRQRIYRFFVRQTGSHHEAEELTQRVFVDAVEARARTQAPPDSTLAWLYTVAQRRMADEIRRRARTPLAAREQPDADRPGHSYGSEIATALRDAIAQLPEEQRTVVVLRLLRGVPFADIAAAQDVSEAACKMRFARAVARIRSALEAGGIRP